MQSGDSRARSVYRFSLRSGGGDADKDVAQVEEAGVGDASGALSMPVEGLAPGVSARLPVPHGVSGDGVLVLCDHPATGGASVAGSAFPARSGTSASRSGQRRDRGECRSTPARGPCAPVHPI